MSPSVVIDVRELDVQAPGGEPIIEGLSFSVSAGETLGLVGESGSGKTTTALAVLGYTQGGARITGGEVTVAGQSMRIDSERTARQMRGRIVSYVPQNPGGALNPSMRIGAAIEEMWRAHGGDSGVGGDVGQALSAVGLPDTSEFRRRFPHQLSGGQQQRVCISVALACEPPVVVLDEPTTGLDVITQHVILEELRRLRREHELSMLYVTHDLAVVAQLADRVAVMYAGRIVEEGAVREVLMRPRHPYTLGLVSSIPDHVRPRVLQAMPNVAVGVGNRPPGCAFAPRCPLRIDECERRVPDLAGTRPARRTRCIRSAEVPPLQQSDLTLSSLPTREGEPLLVASDLRAEYRSRAERKVVVDGVSFSLRAGECVAIVGESGSGKTTIARALVGLHPLAAGEVTLAGELLANNVRRRSASQRRRMQIVFQNPADVLNPRQTVRTALGRSLKLARGTGIDHGGKEIDRLLDLVRLPHGIGERYPIELSGGERQRIGIARALAARPDVLICDEITSSLDVSAQAAILRLLRDLREELGLAVLFITHDLGVVAQIADRVLVLQLGQVCESAPVAEILSKPVADYTQRLLAAAPSISFILQGWEDSRQDGTP